MGSQYHELMDYKEDFDLLFERYFYNYKSILLYLAAYYDIKFYSDVYNGEWVHAVMIEENNKSINLLEYIASDKSIIFYHLFLYFYYSEMRDELRSNNFSHIINGTYGIHEINFNDRKYNPECYRLFRILSSHSSRKIIHINPDLKTIPIASLYNIKEYCAVSFKDSQYDIYLLAINMLSKIEREKSFQLKHIYDISNILSSFLDNYETIVINYKKQILPVAQLVEILSILTKSSKQKYIFIQFEKDFLLSKESNSIKYILSRLNIKSILEDDNIITVTILPETQSKISIAKGKKQYYVDNMTHNMSFCYLPDRIKNRTVASHTMTFLDDVCTYAEKIPLNDDKKGYIIKKHNLKKIYLEGITSKPEVSSYKEDLYCYTTPCIMITEDCDRIIGTICDDQYPYAFAENDITCIKCKSDVYINYLYYYLLNNDFSEYSTAIGINGILQNISDICIEIPSKDEQIKIINQIDNTICNNVTAICIGYKPSSDIFNILSASNISTISIESAIYTQDDNPNELSLETILRTGSIKNTIIVIIEALAGYDATEGGYCGLRDTLSVLKIYPEIKYYIYTDENKTAILDTIRSRKMFRSFEKLSDTIIFSTKDSDSSMKLINQIKDEIKIALSPEIILRKNLGDEFKAAEWLDLNVRSNIKGETYGFKTTQTICNLYNNMHISDIDIRNCAHRIITLLMKKKIVPEFMKEGAIVNFLQQKYISENTNNGFYIMIEECVPHSVVCYLNLLVSLTNKMSHGVSDNFSQDKICLNALLGCLKWIYAFFIEQEYKIDTQYFISTKNIKPNINNGILEKDSLNNYWYCGNVHINVSNHNELNIEDRIKIDYSKIKPEKQPRIIRKGDDTIQPIIYFYKLD